MKWKYSEKQENVHCDSNVGSTLKYTQLQVQFSYGHQSKTLPAYTILIFKKYFLSSAFYYHFEVFFFSFLFSILPSIKFTV